jgi:oxygen-independent coproporphyrinogen-3 oxidase
MHPKAIGEMLNCIHSLCHMKDDVEITMEANPATFDINRMKNFRDAGINRISLGVQSFSDKNLHFLGRIYDGKQAMIGAEIVAEIFENFSFDLIYGYQNAKNLEKDLLRAIGFECKHISCYQLTFEEGTPFHLRLLAGDIRHAAEKTIIESFTVIREILLNHDIQRYEISNYAIPGFESRHNLSYWKYDDYLGVGPGAHSRVSLGGRKQEMIKIANPFLWEKSVGNDTFTYVKTLSKEEKLAEAIIVGLRLAAGIPLADLRRKSSRKTVDAIISRKQLDFLLAQRLITNAIHDVNPTIRLTDDGLMKIDSVAEFLLNNLAKASGTVVFLKKM